MVLSRGLRVHSRPSASGQAVLIESRSGFGGTNEALLFDDGAVTQHSESCSRKPRGCAHLPACLLLPAAEEFDKIKKDFTRVTDAYGFLGVLAVHSRWFRSVCILPPLSLFSLPPLVSGLCDSFAVFVTACLPVGKFNDTEFFRITGVETVAIEGGDESDSSARPRLGSAARNAEAAAPTVTGASSSPSKATLSPPVRWSDGIVGDIRKLYSSGTFYVTSGSYDLTVPLQCQPAKLGPFSPRASRLPTVLSCSSFPLPFLPDARRAYAPSLPEGRPGRFQRDCPV
jgi:hypothetical protein